MAGTPKKVVERIAAGIRRFQPIVASAKSRDVNESDTVIVVTDMLAEVFGYDKYAEITSEHSIRSTFCDLAIRLDGRVQLLIEVKAIGLDLKDAHVKQAVDYAANQGVDWVALTNGETWRVYKVGFAKPITHEVVVEFAMSALNPKTAADLELVSCLTKEGWQRSALGDLHERRQALSRFFLGAVLLSDAVIEVVRRELRRLSPNVKVESDEIRAVLVQDVLKREVVEGEQADTARKATNRAATRRLRKSAEVTTEVVADVAQPAAAGAEGEGNTET